MTISPEVHTILAAPDPDAQLIRNGRYYIVPEGSKDLKAKPLTRVTNFARELEDTYSLVQWQKRMVALGVAQNPHIAAAVVADSDDRTKLNDLAEAAMEAAKAGAARDMGSALHRICERADSGERFPVPEPWLSDLNAYRACLATYGIEIVDEYIEQVIVCPELELAGRFDRIVRFGKGLCVLDLKGLALDTPIPTVDGWRTMGSIQVGDLVFDRSGRPTPVLAKSELRQRPCYRIKFDDGSDVICDDEHRWAVVETGRQQRRQMVVTTAELRALLGARKPARQQSPHYTIPNACPLDLPEADLAVDPYVLGVWLGDGTRRRSTLNLSEDKRPIVEEIRRLGFEVVEGAPDKRGQGRQFYPHGLIGGLRSLGLGDGDKFVPAAYLRASATQRLALLQGLCDTDGSWHKSRHQVVVAMTDKQMVTDIHELVMSLGWRASRHEHPVTGFGKTVTAYTVSFTPHTWNPFRADSSNQQEAQERIDGTKVSRRRLIRSVEPTVTVPTQCIAVGGDHTYLCGDQMVPTHNTGADLSYSWGSIAVQLALYAGATTIYDPETATHRSMPPVAQDYGLVLHLPAGSGEASLHTVDLAAGRHGIEVIKSLKAWRKAGGEVAAPFTTFAPPTIAPNGSDPDSGEPFPIAVAGEAESAPGADANPAQEPAPSTMPGEEPVSAALRAYVEHRVADCIADGHGAELARRWPSGVPTLKAKKDHFEAEVDQILEVVRLIESSHRVELRRYFDPRNLGRSLAGRVA